MQNSATIAMSQDNVEKVFFEQLKPGDFIDARYAENDWKLAKVIDREQKFLTIIFDGYPPTSEVSTRLLSKCSLITWELKLYAQLLWGILALWKEFIRRWHPYQNWSSIYPWSIACWKWLNRLQHIELLSICGVSCLLAWIACWWASLSFQK